MGKYSRHIAELEYDLKPEIKVAIETVAHEVDYYGIDTKPKDLEQLERELLSLSSLHYEAARLKRRGMSYNTIAEKLNVTPVMVRTMINKVLDLSNQALPKEAEWLRTEVLQQIDDVIDGLYTEAEHKNFGGKIGSSQAGLVLSALDKKVKLLGLNAPEKIDININQEVSDAQRRIDEQLKRIEASEIIDAEFREMQEQIPEHKKRVSLPDFDIDSDNS